MKNKFYNRHGIYNIIRKHYLKNFPYPTQFEALNAINEHLNSIDESVHIKKVGDEYKLIQPTHHKEEKSKYETQESNVFVYLSQPSGIAAVFQDVNTYHEWLNNNGFIADRIATEKMLVTDKL